MKIPDFKNRKYNELNKQEKIAFIERVCMDNIAYLNEIGRGNKEALFINHWKDHVLKHPAPSNSTYLDHYYYSEELSLCVVDKNGALSSLRYNIYEVVLFVYNAVTSAPVRSNLIDRIIAGDSITDIEDTGVEKIDALKIPSFKRKMGRPGNPNSLAQRVKRGEITRYEAYQKKSVTASDDDAL